MIAALAVSGYATEMAPQPPRRSLVFYILPVQAPVLTARLAKALSTVLPDVDVRFVDSDRGPDDS